jgi:hypothetical protein
MSDRDSLADDLSPAEQRLAEHLELLRASPPIPAPEMIERIISRARWQRTIRDPLVLVGAVAIAVGEGLGLLIERSPEH